MQKSVRKQHCLMDKVALIRQLNVTNYDNTPLQYTANLLAVKGSFKWNLFVFFSLDTCVFKALINTSICRLPSSVIIITTKISFSCD